MSDRLSIVVVAVLAALGVVVTGGSGTNSMLAVAVGIPFLFGTSMRTKVAAYFLALPLVFGLKYQYPSVPVQAVPGLIAVALLAHVAWELLALGRRIPLRHPAVFFAGSFAVAVVLLSQTPLVAERGTGVAGARVYLEPMALFVVGLVHLRRQEDALRFMKVTLVAGLLVGLYGLRQLIFGFDHGETAYFLGTLNERVLLEHRLFSTLGSPEAYGFVSGLFLLVALSALASGMDRRLPVIVGSLSALGVLSAGTRISLIGTSIAGALHLSLLLRGRHHRNMVRVMVPIAAGAIVAVLVMVALTPVGSRDDTFKSSAVEATVQKLALLKRGTADENVNSRLERARLFVDFEQRYPWGEGAGTLALFRRSDAYNAQGERVQRLSLPPHLADAPWIFQRDYFYIGLGIELGVIPLVLFITLLVSGIVLGIRGWRRASSPAVGSLLALTTSTAALALIQNLTNEAFRRPQVASYVWFLLAAPVAYGSVVTPRRESVAA